MTSFRPTEIQQLAIEAMLVAEKKIRVVIPDEGHVLIKALIERCLDYDRTKRPSLDKIVSELEKVQNLNKYYGKIVNLLNL